MLPPFIIEQIRKREDEEAHPYRQPVLELPLPMPEPENADRRRDDEPERGVVIIDLMA